MKVFDGSTHAAIADFDAFEPSFRGGVRVATGDVNGDGRADLLLGTGPGAGQVKVLDANGLALLGDFRPFGTAFSGGVFVAAGDLDGDGTAEPVIGPDENPNGEWRIYVLDDGFGTAPEDLDIMATIEPFVGFPGGIRVATGDLDGDALADLLFAPGPGHAPTVRRMRGFDRADLGDFDAFGPSFTGGIFVGAATIPTPEADGAGVAALLGLAACARRRAARPRAPD